jgi:hypothetical protein
MFPLTPDGVEAAMRALAAACEAKQSRIVGRSDCFVFHSSQ